MLRTSCVSPGGLLGGGDIDTRPRRARRMPPSKGMGVRGSDAVLCHHGVPRKDLLKDATSPELKRQWHFGQCFPCQTNDWALTSSLGFWS